MAPPEAPEVIYKQLPRWKVILFTVLVPLSMVTFTAGAVGTYVLTGLERVVTALVSA